MYCRIWIIIFLSLKTRKICVVNDTDQTVVMLRPKYYIGSSGSVWSSDYMFLRYTFETAVVIFFLSFNIFILCLTCNLKKEKKNWEEEIMCFMSMDFFLLQRSM